MGIIGKGVSSFKKQDVKEQKSIALGFSKIRFAHKATLGDTGINLASLVAPTEMTANGFVNPSAAAIARSQIQRFRNNLKLVSSTKGLLVDQLSYVVASGTSIRFLDFTADDGEIFQGWLDEAPTTSLSVVDGKTIVASGTLLAGQTDFNIGMPITINQNSAQQIGAVMVFEDRGLAYRKVGNITTGDGDYIEVPVAGGLGSLIRFNASASDRFITVMSNGVVAERPDGSMTAMIERVQGQVDAMIPTLAEVAGVPETNFQTAPNDVDLKQFGDKVLGYDAIIASVVASLAAKRDKADGTGLKIGYNATAGSAFSMAAGHLHFIKVVAAADATLNTLTAFKAAQPAGIKSTMGIYSSVGGVPNTKLGQTNEYTTAIGAFGSADGGTTAHTLLAPVSIVKGQTYWLAYIQDTTANIETAFAAPSTGLYVHIVTSYNTVLPTNVAAGPYTSPSGGLTPMAGW